MSKTSLPIAIYYEHPDWFRSLFSELDRRGVPYVALDARRHAYDPSASRVEHALFFNRMSPSAYLRGGRGSIFYTLSYLSHLERLGARVVNGREAFTFETSKALQASLLRWLGLPAPRTIVINAPEEAPRAAHGFRFPVIVKANVGGSGAGLSRFDSMSELELAVEEQRLDLGIDGTAIVQEFLPARGGHIVRVETLGGKYLYAIKVFTSGESFNLCPADICRTTSGEELARSACPVNAPRNGLRVEAYTPPAEVIDAVEAIVAAAGIEVGGVEYMVDDRDGRINYYDINALSNFVADAERVVGFDPHARLADYLEREAL